MGECTSCGGTLAATARFCQSCGARVAAPSGVPASAELRALSAAPRQGNVAAFAVGLLALAVLAGGVAFLALRDDDSPSRVAPATTVAEAGTTAGSTTTAPPVVLTPEAWLHATQDVDRPKVEALVGRWVPQLSSKRDGIEADGITYTLADIQKLQTRLRAQYGALLLWTGDYVFEQGDLWASIVPIGYATADEALAWCASTSFARGDCMAKLITHDTSVGDTAKQMP